MLFEFKSKKIYESDALFCKKIIAMATFSYLEGHFSPIPCLLFNSFAYLCIMILKRLSILNYRNIATAELLVLGLARGDLAWRDIVNPSTRPIA